MKLATTVTPVAALVSTAVAYSQFEPFKLQTVSIGHEYNGKYVSVCHTGTTAETFYFSNPSNTNFQLNTTSRILTWNIVMTSGNVRSGVAIVPSLNTNVAQSSISVSPGDATTVVFDEKELLYITGKWR
jgi:hypothetical protein